MSAFEHFLFIKNVLFALSKYFASPQFLIYIYIYIYIYMYIYIKEKPLKITHIFCVIIISAEPIFFKMLHLKKKKKKRFLLRLKMQ